jgi:lipopolysaccharide transport system ATP-binding protein
MVSHSLDTVRTMCTRALWFEHGQVRVDGTAEAVARHYLDATNAVEAKRLTDAAAQTQQRWGTRQIEITRVRLLDGAGAERSIFETGERLTIEMDYFAHAPITAPIFGVGLHRQDGVHITGPNTAFAGLTLPTLSGAGTVRYAVPALPLLDGLYHVSVAVVNQTDTETYDSHDHAYPFRVLNPARAAHERYGLLTLRGEWQLRSSG